MPSKKKPCPHFECKMMISAKSSFCRKHWIRTKDHILNQAKTQKGKIFSSERKKNISDSKKLAAIRLGNASTLSNCQYCNNLMLVKPSQKKNGAGKFCSSTCSYSARVGEKSSRWKGGAETRVCPQCNKDFQRTPAAFKGSVNYFCSLSCRSIYNKPSQSTSRTDIERLMSDGLSKAGIEYIEQYGITRICVADFYLPSHRIVIFCDGEYWHNLEKTKNKDLRQNAMLSSAGYRVLRFWGEEIKQNLKSCIQSIKRETKRVVIESPQLCLWG